MFFIQGMETDVLVDIQIQIFRSMSYLNVPFKWNKLKDKMNIWGNFPFTSRTSTRTHPTENRK